MRRAHQGIAFTLILAAFGLFVGCSRTAQAPKKGEILVWHWLTDREEALQKLADAYQKETGIKVVLELYAPSDAYASKVRAAAQTNTLPDIFSVLGETRDLASFINSGHIASLTAAMEADHSAWKKQFFPKALATDTLTPHNQYKVVPGIYGVPLDVSNIQMLYNKELFQKAGLDPNRPPQTWNEFIQAWRKLKAAGIPGMVSGWGETWMIDCFANNYAFNIMGEQKVLDTYRGKVSYNDPDWIQVLSLFETLRNEGLLVPGVVTMVNKSAEQAFATGKAAFAFNGSWCVNVYHGMNPNLSFAAMLPPRVTNKNPVRIWGGAGTSLMVNDTSLNKEEAIKFLKWLTQAPQQAQLSKETYNLPANRNSLGDIPQTLSSFAGRLDMTTHPSPGPVVEKPTVVEALDKGIQSILIGEKTPAQVAADVQKIKDQQTAK
jgi:ABC-type glycerol-3-phosphate transport system substrate-binding protein